MGCLLRAQELQYPSFHRVRDLQTPWKKHAALLDLSRALIRTIDLPSPHHLKDSLRPTHRYANACEGCYQASLERRLYILDRLNQELAPRAQVNSTNVESLFGHSSKLKDDRPVKIKSPQKMFPGDARNIHTKDSLRQSIHLASS